MKIIVDADACPKGALSIAIKAGKERGLEVITVANFNHNIESDRHIIVGDDSQEADIRIINETKRGDIVITQDWGLAAMVLSKNAACLSPIGIEYQNDRMDMMLEERELKAKIRRSGVRTKGPSKRTAEDDNKFGAALRRIIERKTA